MEKNIWTLCSRKQTYVAVECLGAKIMQKGKSFYCWSLVKRPHEALHNLRESVRTVRGIFSLELLPR